MAGNTFPEIFETFMAMMAMKVGRGGGMEGVSLDQTIESLYLWLITIRRPGVYGPVGFGGSFFSKIEIIPS